MDNKDIEQKFADMAQKYDSHIHCTIPGYEDIFVHTINLIQSVNPSPGRWLDTGCGTGAMAEKAIKHFPHTEFFLCDPSPHMLRQAQKKAALINQPLIHIGEQTAATQELDFPDQYFDVITAIQAHHYMSKHERKQAVQNCFRQLKEGGILVTFENVRPFTDMGIDTGLHRWKQFQITAGKTAEEATQHTQRFDKEYYPITIEQHLELPRKSGFTVVEMLWMSYMQAGFYAIK